MNGKVAKQERQEDWITLNLEAGRVSLREDSKKVHEKDSRELVDNIKLQSKRFLSRLVSHQIPNLYHGANNHDWHLHEKLVAEDYYYRD